MSAAVPALPPGYEAFEVGRARVVAKASIVGAVREAMGAGTLCAWAASQPGAQALAGRGIAWSVALPDGTPVVVRHSRHGGLLAPFTGDLFLAPTRAPRELDTAERLARAGVPTPKVAAYAVYPALGLFRRADVASCTLAGADFPAAWSAAPDEAARLSIVRATAMLLGTLQRAGASHPDLNLKNVFLVGRHGDVTAFVLDVDRVEFGAPDDPAIAERNVARLVRSARKWRERRGLAMGEEHLVRLAAAALSHPRGIGR